MFIFVDVVAVVEVAAGGGVVVDVGMAAVVGGGVVAFALEVVMP